MLLFRKLSIIIILLYVKYLIMDVVLMKKQIININHPIKRMLFNFLRCLFF